MSKRKYTSVEELYINKPQQIKNYYAKGVSVTKCAERYNVSYNTMLLLLGMLGFEVSPGFMGKAKVRREKIEAKIAKRRANAGK